MSKLVKGKLPCPNCDSSNAYHIYDDGHGYCFSCEARTQATLDNPKVSLEYPKEDNHLNHSFQYIPLRGITKDTLKLYDCKTKVSEEGEPLEIHLRYSEDTFKIRSLKVKDFKTKGNIKEHTLFGRSLFHNNQAQAITITEGELDAMSAFQMLGSKYPVVSVRSSASARTDCTKEFEFLNSFDKIYLCFDNDHQGQKAARQVASLFNVNKIYNVWLDKFKDANDYLQHDEEKAFKNAWWGAKKYMPKGIVSSWDEIASLLNKEEQTAIGEYPFSTLQEMTYGIRPGEIVLLTAPEKIGKTEVLRAIEHHVLKTTDHNIGIIHLEESERRSIQGLVGYELRKPVHLPDSGVASADVLRVYKDIVRRDGRLHFYSHFGTEDKQVILDTVRFLAGACDCRLIFFDHITMAVVGNEEDDERRALDYISQQLAMMVRELNFNLHMISHVNDDGKTRGSRYIAKVADTILSLNRDLDNPNPYERNKTYLNLKGNRYAGLTGPAGCLEFDSETFTLKEYTGEDKELKELPF